MATVIHSLVSSLMPVLAPRITPAAQSAPAVSSPAAPAPPADPGIDPLANEQTFLQLMVAQMRNQNPLNPADSTQFVAQLAQFSQLEQSLAMRQDLDAIRQSLAQLAAAGPPATPAP